MGINCCQKPEDELILETYQGEDKNNVENENGIEKENNNVKDKYPHDSDAAFKPKRYEESKGMVDSMKNQNGQQEIINEFGEDIQIVN